MSKDEVVCGTSPNGWLIAGTGSLSVTCRLMVTASHAAYLASKVGELGHARSSAFTDISSLSEACLRKTKHATKLSDINVPRRLSLALGSDNLVMKYKSKKDLCFRPKAISSQSLFEVIGNWWVVKTVQTRCLSV